MSEIVGQTKRWRTVALRGWPSLRGLCIGTKFLLSRSCLILGFVCASVVVCECADVPNEMAQSRKLYAEGKCQEAWDKLWKLVENRDYDTLLSMFLTTRYFVFSPLLNPKESIDFKVPSVIYGTLTPERNESPWPHRMEANIDYVRVEVRKVLPKVLEQFTPAGPGRSAVVDCFRSLEPASVCVKLAVDSHFIPEFDAYTASQRQVLRGRVQCPPKGARLD